jgi:hypothetical protein
MKSRTTFLGVALVAALAALGLSCKGTGKGEGKRESESVRAPAAETEPRPYEPIGADAEALRAAFNADAGKVRLIVLVAPT